MLAWIKGYTDQWKEYKIQKLIQTFIATEFSKGAMNTRWRKNILSLKWCWENGIQRQTTDRQTYSVKPRHQLRTGHESKPHEDQVRSQKETDESGVGILRDTGKDSVLEKTSNAQTTTAKIDRWDCVILWSCEWQRKQSAGWRGSLQNDGACLKLFIWERTNRKKSVFKWGLALSQVKIRKMVNNCFKNVRPGWPPGKHKRKSRRDITSFQLAQVLPKRWKTTINANRDAGRMVLAQPLRKTAQRLLKP